MNYRHAFHAGNFADVVKHLILSRLIDYLKRKPSAFRVLDTHAGIGLYDLAGGEAERTGEWREGIGRLLQSPLEGAAAELAAPYLEVVQSLNPEGSLRFYPGSPVLARRLLRPQDRLFALELHKDDVRLLAQQFAGDVQARVTQLDGWQALGTHLPPKEKRGLVLVDPPFEEPGEFNRLVGGLVKAHRRFPGGIYALWYPLKDPVDAEDFRAALSASGIGRILCAELTLRAPSRPPRLFGTGMILVNPPFTLEAELSVLLPALADRLAEGGRGGYRLAWIAGE